MKIIVKRPEIFNLVVIPAKILVPCNGIGNVIKTSGLITGCNR